MVTRRSRLPVAPPGSDVEDPDRGRLQEADHLEVGPEAQLGRRTTDAIIADIVHRLPLPLDRQRAPYEQVRQDNHRRR